MAGRTPLEAPRRRAAIALLVAAVCTLHASLAEAAPFELTWSAAPDCPSRERMVAATRARLGESETNAPPELFVRGTVTEEEGAIVVTLQMKDAEGSDVGERQVRYTGRSCAAIEEPTALVLATMIAVAGPHAATAKPEASPAPKSTPPPPPPVPAREPERIPLTASAAAVSSLGLLPNVGFGGALRLTAAIASRVVLGLETSFETAPSIAAGANGEASFRFFDAAALAGIRVLRSRRFELVPLVEVRGGALTASPTGFRLAEDTTRFVGILAAGALGRVLLGPHLRIEALPDVRVPFVRDEFQVREGTELVRVHRPAAVEARLSLGIGWEFR